MEFHIAKALKSNIRLRLALCGPPGSGKTWTALEIAKHLGGKVGMIDTEHGSAAKYADRFDFDVIALTSFEPEKFVGAIEAMAEGKYDILVVDSLSHAWAGKGGILQQADEIARRSKSGNTFAAWREATPMHESIIEALLSYPGHVIVTMRSKTEYSQDKDERTGKMVIRRLGMAPVQREGVEYEFDIVGELDQDHTLVITKSRAFELADSVIKKPGRNFATRLQNWLSSGVRSEEHIESEQVDKPEKKAVPQREAFDRFSASAGLSEEKKTRGHRDPEQGASPYEQAHEAEQWLLTHNVKTDAQLRQARREHLKTAVKKEFADAENPQIDEAGPFTVRKYSEWLAREVEHNRDSRVA